MPILDNKNNIGIWGFGKEAQSALRFIQDRKPSVSVKIYSDQADLFHDIHSEESLEHDINQGDLDLIIKSPGISLYHPLCDKMRAQNIEISSATNLWFDHYRDKAGKIIVITGTKGKSTTASLLQHLLSKLGYDTVLAGNIGTNLLDQKITRDFTVIELSSYQLADLHFTSDLFLVTNLFQEHVPWHGSVEQYFKDKLQLKLNNPDLPTIANGYNETLRKYLEALDNVTWVEDIGLLKDWPQKFKATHLQENALVALFAIEYFTKKLDQAVAHLESFAGLPHRLEEVGVKNGILYVNDSISTIPEATLAALNLYADKKIGLIMGGSDRGQHYETFADSLKDFDIKDICILPDHEFRLEAALNDKGFHGEVTLSKTLEDALIHLKTRGDIDLILLSPGAPSYAQFKNFEERGDVFKKLSGF